MMDRVEGGRAVHSNTRDTVSNERAITSTCMAGLYDGSNTVGVSNNVATECVYTATCISRGNPKPLPSVNYEDGHI